jgi:hypothetical protein
MLFGFPIVVDERLHVPAATGAVHVAPVLSLTVTFPVGVPAPGAVTVVDHVTAYDWFTRLDVPSAAAFVIVVAVVAWFTVCPPGSTPRLPLKLASPEYVTTTGCGLNATPNEGRPETVHVATPDPLIAVFGQ